MSTKDIMKDMGWASFPQLITIDSVRIIHQINIYGKPKSLSKFFKFSNNRETERRLVRTPTLKYTPKLPKTLKSQLYRGIYYYSKLPLELRTANAKIFKNKITSHISKNFNTYCLERPVT